MIQFKETALPYGLYDHQKLAVEAWSKAGGKGIFRMVTGAGKTVSALACICETFKKDPKTRVHIIVPTVSLLKQWKAVFLEKTTIDPAKIGLYYGGQKDDSIDKSVMIYVINSAANAFSKKGGEVMRGFLIVDECHRSGAKSFKEIYKRNFKYVLGLSATPERKYDDSFKNYIEPNLGPVVFRYSFTEAVRDGVIPPYELNLYPINFTATEHHEYDETSEKMKKNMARLRAIHPGLRLAKGNAFFAAMNKLVSGGDKFAKTAWAMMMARSHMIFDATEREGAVVDILAHERGSKVIIFHEKIKGADEIFADIRACGFKAGRYHTGIDKKEREKWFKAFKTGQIDVLVTCKAFDEGIDVPSIDVAIIAAGTSGNRQMIQRSGRALRKREGKNLSRIYVIYLEGIKEENDLMKEDGRMSEIADAATEIYRIRRK